MKLGRFIGYSYRINGDYFDDAVMNTEREARAAETHRRAGELRPKREMSLEQRAKYEHDWDMVMLLKDNYRGY